MIIPDFGVSTAILNITDFFCRWCKLNFVPLRGHVNFPETLVARRQWFCFSIQISSHNWQEATWKTLLDNDLSLLLPFKRN